MTENIEFIITDYISDEELHTFEDNYDKACKAGHVDPTLQFEYGWALIRSQYKDDVRKGVNLLSGLCNTNIEQRDFLFFISIGYYKVEEYNDALKYVKMLLAIEPNNGQGISLQEAIKQKLKKRGAIGMALVGGAAALVGVVVAAALSRK